MSDHPLERLFATIQARRSADPADSYTAGLLAKGPMKIAKKLGEEGVEAALAGAAGTLDELAGESADLLYHLLVLWTVRGLDPQLVWKELAKRDGKSGLAEKAARGEG